jgi:hypothetical protein
MAAAPEAIYPIMALSGFLFIGFAICWLSNVGRETCLPI